MKNPISYLLVSLFMILSSNTGVYAQATATKPSLFDNQPNEVEVSAATLANIINAAEGTPVTVSLTNTFFLNGLVVSNVQKYSNLKTVIVKLLNYPDVTLSISKMSDIHTPEKYVGRIIGLKFSDSYELHLNNNIYTLKKQKTDNLVQPCK
jgi:hypothetical protein